MTDTADVTKELEVSRSPLHPPSRYWHPLMIPQSKVSLVGCTLDMKHTWYFGTRWNAETRNFRDFFWSTTCLRLRSVLSPFRLDSEQWLT
jgi:hypothetical protein